jgi:hypothetical protein
MAILPAADTDPPRAVGSQAAFEVARDRIEDDMGRVQRIHVGGGSRKHASYLV